MRLHIIHRLFLTTVLLLSSLLTAVSFTPGSGRDVTFEEINRERPFYYHSNTDDQHWYGTNKWAVRFDFTSHYPAYANSRFVVNKIRAYFPVIPDPGVSITAELRSDANNQPAILLFTTTTQITSNWMEFFNPQPDTVGVAWVIITCNTTPVGPYVSASMGGGANSYYWNLSAPVPYFQNMSLAGINSELLFSVVGRFELSNFDFELYSFDLKPDVVLSSQVNPQFRLINNSAQQINNAYIQLDISSPNPALTIQDTVQITRPINPYEDITFLYNSPELQQYTYQMPDEPSQIKVRAVLHSEFNATDTLSWSNNIKTKYYNLFNQPIPVNLVENYIREELHSSMLTAQDNNLYPSNRVINFFPNINDSFYSSGAEQRFNWYGFTGLPMTVGAGDSIITGYLPSTYVPRFNQLLSGINSRKTFIQQSNVNVSFTSPFTQLQIRLTLRNPETYVFTGGTDPSLISQSRFYAALCKKVQMAGLQRYVFNRWSAYRDTINTSIAFTESYLRQFNVTVSDINPDSLFASYDLIYWIQHNNTRQIIYANLIRFDQLVAVEDDVIPSIGEILTLAPNPIKAGTALNVLLSAKHVKSKILYVVYNIKGQRVSAGDLEVKSDSPVIETKDLKTTGIYIIRFYLQDEKIPQKKIEKTAKILVY